MRTILGSLLALLISCLGVYAGMEDFPEKLSQWVKKMPVDNSDEYWLMANGDIDHEWTVFLREDRPSARLDKRVPSKQEPLPFKIAEGTSKEGLVGDRVCIKVSDGWIVGFDAGEWGGAVWWFSHDGKKRANISKDQVIKFFDTNAGILAFEGLAHGGVSRGQIIRIIKGKDDLWHSETIGDLKGAPETACKGPDGTLIVATSDRLLRIHPETKKVDVLVKDAFWGILYPNSMICTLSGTIYIGMRHGVAEIEKSATDYQVKWLIPSEKYEKIEMNRLPGIR